MNPSAFSTFSGHRRNLRKLVLRSPWLLALAACAANGKNVDFDESVGPATPAQGLPEASGGLGSFGNDDGGSATLAPSGAPRLYAHTDTTLFQLDPQDMGGRATVVGDFDCVGKGDPARSMTDIAVAKNGKLFGVSEGAAFPLVIQGSVVHCETKWPLPKTKFYGLTVAPENTLNREEVLVGADSEGGLYEIDAASGIPTQVGTLGKDPKTRLPWALSGDIVFLSNFGNPIGFATVRTCPSSGPCAAVDTLIEVDVKAIKRGSQSVLKSVRGSVKRGVWCTNPASPASFASMFGIVAYKDVVYGFSRDGEVVEMHNSDGSGCLISKDPTRKFAGAGITTLAPVTAAPVN